MKTIRIISITVLVILTVFYIISLILAKNLDLILPKNLVGSGIQPVLEFKTKLNTKIIRTISDTLNKNNWKHRLPKYWSNRIEHYGMDTKYISCYYYFFPEDTINSIIKSEEVFEVKISNCYITIDKIYSGIDLITGNSKFFSEDDKKKAIEKFQKEILNVVEQEAKKKGIPDSLIYCKE
jgi:hypothetical protein